MPGQLHKELLDGLIPATDRESLIAYGDALSEELPLECGGCPAAFVCLRAMQEDSGFGYPRTPTAVRHMKISHGLGSYSMLSGQAQFALKGIVSSANERGTGPSPEGDKCCLDPEELIDINEADPYDW